MMKRINPRISTYIKWFLSYVMVLILPFLLGCGIYKYMLDSARAEVNSIQELNLHQTESLVENTITDARNISEALLGDKKVILLMNLIPEANYSEATLLKEIAATIRNYETGNHLISSIYICMQEKEYVITDSSYFRYDWVQNSAQSFFGVSYEEFEKMIKEDNGKHFILTGKDENVGAYYVYPSYLWQGNQNASVVVLIRYKADMLAKLLTAEDYLTGIWQSEENYLLSDGIWSEEARTLVTGTVVDKNEDYFVTQRQVEGDTRIINLMDKEEYMRPVRKMSNILFVYVIGCLLVGGAMAWYLARKNYSPVKELAEVAERLSDEEGGSDDFERIRTSLERLARNDTSRRNVIKQREEQTRLAVLSRFMQDRCFGRAEQVMAYDILDSYFEESEIVLLAFEVEMEEDEKEEENQVITLETLELPFFVVRNITEELLGREYRMLMIECQGLAVCLVGVPKENSSLNRAGVISDIRRVAERVCSYTKEYFRYAIVSDISGIHPKGEKIQEAYAELQELVNYRDTVGSAMPVIDYAAFCSVREKELELPKAAPEYSRIPSEEMMKEVASYIEKHYDDKNLSAGYLADQLGMSLSNLSQMFKRYQGVGLLEYISQVRLARAKELLMQGRTVKETAEMVGFWTTRPLANLFNQVEGATPMAWKKQEQMRRNHS